MGNNIKNHGQVDYSVLDAAKLKFIESSKKTLDFASKYGNVLGSELGASANVFCPEISQEAFASGITLVTEGLGTADDARPDDISDTELKEFWYNIAFKVMSCLSNDVVSGGLQTILVSLYLPSADPELVFTNPFIDGFLEGFVEACRQVSCVYISGETPQLRGKFIPEKLDIAGSAFGISIANKDSDIARLMAIGPEEGDQIILLASSGPHENGFTPIRSLASKLPKGFREPMGNGVELYKAANAPSVLYTALIREIIEANCSISGLQNISGHGWQKIMRSHKNLSYVIDNILPVPEIFNFLAYHMKASSKDMLSIFNYGAGFAVYVKKNDDVKKILKLAEDAGINALHAGYIEASKSRKVVVRPLEVEISDEDFSLKA